jgi:hypothetical protein
MKKALYVIGKLGFLKSALYLILYPLSFLKIALVKLDDLHDEIRWQKKIFIYFKNAGILSAEEGNRHILTESKNYFNKYGFSINTDWTSFYSKVSGYESKYYIPEDLFYREIEPNLTNQRLLSFYSDKNLYDQIFEGVKQPKTYLRYINGTFYCPKYNKLSFSEAEDQLSGISEPWLIKPSVDSGNGRNIKQGDSHYEKLIVDGVETTLTKLANFYGSGFIVQEKIMSQNKTLAQFHPGSLNTFRVITLRLKNQIYNISNRLKFGTGDRIVDNYKGVWCGVDNNGIIHSNGINAAFQKFIAHPDTDKRFKGTKIPEFEKILEFARQLHERVISMDLVSWDIGYSALNEPVFIECNVKFQGVTTSQVINGPLFGEFTDGVLTEIARRKTR